MAEDRMLSDEILLGIINSKSGGGGGGGTDDYNDLKNQPQINNNTLIGNKSASDLGLVAAEAGKGLSSNDYTDEDKDIVDGVTEALADKADKSAVKNEFIGTLAEWNALTAEQRKAYDAYQLTDDYTEGSGGLPDYSTTEQLTGQKWTDGKDIYFRTYENLSISMTRSEWVALGVDLSGIDYWRVDNEFMDNRQYPLHARDNNNALEGLCQYDVTLTRFTLYYTKTE